MSIVCKNNAGTIGRTLESVKGIATEIVAVDSGSTDGTIELLERYGARIIRSEWLGHVKTKQMALEACGGEWVLCLDSDESLEHPEDVSFFTDLLQDSTPIAGYEIRRIVYYDERPLRFAWQPEWRLRLVRKGKAAWGGLDPHDQLAAVDALDGVVRWERGFIRHDSISTWSEFLAKQAVHSKTMAHSLYVSGHNGSIRKLVASPIGAFLKQLILKQSWRDGWVGWVAAGSSAAGSLMKHAMLLELSRRHARRSGVFAGLTPGEAQARVSDARESSQSRPKTLQSGSQRTDA